MAENKKNSKKGKQATSEESKVAGGKVQTLPVQPSSNESTAAIPNDAQNDPEEDKVDEGTPDESTVDESASAASSKQSQKVVDQSKSNIPIADPEPEDFLELLNQNSDILELTAQEKQLLEMGVRKNNFKKTAEIVIAMQQKNHQFDKAQKLQDIIPLFEPHKFWDMQPVPKATDAINVAADQYDKPIETRQVSEVQQEPYGLPAEYAWDELDLNDDDTMEEVYKLLVQNYVEDDDAMFRFDYSIPFLRWALMPPGHTRSWHLGVRAGKNRRLFGMITGIPVQMVFNGKQVMCAEINFLCVHKDLRAKRLAPVLIKEITRRVNRQDIWQAIYTAGATLPTPITGATYWHRSLNPKKLCDVRFSSRPAKMSQAQYNKLHKLPNERNIPTMRAMTQEDVPQVTRLLNTYLANVKVHIVFNEEEVSHFLLPRDRVIYSYVDCQNGDSKITDFFSFYCLPSSILQHTDYDTLWVAYSFYNVSTTDRLQEGVSDMLKFAKEADFDVFNCLDVMENKKFLENLKFGIGDGLLHYYLFNWRIRDIGPEDLGIVLV